MKVYRKIVESPIGQLRLLGNDTALLAISHPGQPVPKRIVEEICDADSHPVLDLAARELVEYFAGERTEFATPVELRGTDFQRAVWQTLLEVPYGETRSYAWVAERIANPKAVRAVGLTNGANPISIVVPCHRIIGKDGSLTGYGGGLESKKTLLAIEGIGGKLF